MTPPAPLLTASWADCLLGYIRKSSNDNGGKKADAMLEALATGRTYCGHVMTEDECRAQFEAWAKVNGTDQYRVTCDRLRIDEAEFMYMVWLACARANGLVADAKREGG